MSEERPLIEVEEVRFGYGRELVLDRVSLSIRRGDFLAILGPNGGGKTTLLQVILGLLRPWSGRIERRLPERRGAIGYVPQFSTFDKNFPLQVIDAVQMGRLGRRGPLARYTPADRRAALEALRRFGLEWALHEPISELSGGELQRVLISRALVSEPEILFLDEPLASIDVEFREVLTETLAELNRSIPIVVVTHDMTPFAGVVRQIACLNRTLHYHAGGKLTAEMLEEVYGCPVELVAHGVPHRVLRPHGP